jgi:serine O-acetyltransferase
MNMSLPSDALSDYVKRLIGLHFPDGRSVDYSPSDFSLALERCEYSFSKIRRKYYQDDGGGVVFDHLNADHMATFLYFLGNSIWKSGGETELPIKLSYLNKILHGLDLFYSVGMPDIFLLVHPLGSVIGNARYSDYLVVYQNCTVGAVDRDYPVFGEGVIFYSRSSVVGKCNVGDDVVFAANSIIVNTDVPSRTVVLGSYPNCRFKENSTSVRARCFDPLFRDHGAIL